MWLLWMPIAGTGLFRAGLCWVWYIALEPYARRVWPSILASWSRLISNVRVRIRDPRIGGAVLAGLVGGSAIAALWPVGFSLLAAMTGIQTSPWIGDWTVVLGQRYVLGDVAFAAQYSVIRSLGIALALVVGRVIFRSRIAGALVVGAVFFIVYFAPQTTAAETAAVAAMSFATAALFTLLLVRFGILALAVSIFLKAVVSSSATTSWTAWHGQTGLTWLIIVGLLAAYGFWAATAGRKLLSDALAETGGGP
jgi:hypothetical protein